MPSATEEIARELIALLRESENVEAIECLYADDVHTEEADPARTRSGKAVVYQSMADFAAAHDFHYTAIEGPLISGNTFALRLAFTATPRTGGQSFSVDEIGVYTVRDGKIARDQFFYEF